MPGPGARQTPTSLAHDSGSAGGYSQQLHSQANIAAAVEKPTAEGLDLPIVIRLLENGQSRDHLSEAVLKVAAIGQVVVKVEV